MTDLSSDEGMNTTPENSWDEENISGTEETRSELETNFLSLHRESPKELESNLHQKRLDTVSWIKARRKEDEGKQHWEKKYHNLDKDYTILYKKVINLVNTCEETDEYIILGDLKLRKKPLYVDYKHENNKDKDVFVVSWDNYSGGTDKMISVRPIVLDNHNHPMHAIVNEAIKEKEGYRPATQDDFNKIISLLPGEDTHHPDKHLKQEQLLALEMFTWWHGRALLEQIGKNKQGEIIHAYAEMFRFENLRTFFTSESQRQMGSIFLVGDIK